MVRRLGSYAVKSFDEFDSIEGDPKGQVLNENTTRRLRALLFSTFVSLVYVDVHETTKRFNDDTWLLQDIANFCFWVVGIFFGMPPIYCFVIAFVCASSRATTRPCCGRTKWA